MPANSHTETVKAFLEAQYAGDLDRAFDNGAHPEFTWIVGNDADPTLNAAIPWAGVKHQGKAEYIGFVSRLFAEFEALEFAPTRFTEAGNQVFMQGRFVFKHRDTGKIATSDFLARFEMKDGRIVGGQFYENTYAVAVARK